MYKVIASLVFMISCSSDLPSETICSPSSALFKDSSTICAALKTCTTGELVEYNKYMCFCDLICICFYSEFTNECIDDTKCKRDNVLMLFGKDFCKLPKNRREELMLDIKNRLKEVPSE
jgi:hypothetical protein